MRFPPSSGNAGAAATHHIRTSSTRCAGLCEERVRVRRAEGMVRRSIPRGMRRSASSQRTADLQTSARPSDRRLCRAINVAFGGLSPAITGHHGSSFVTRVCHSPRQRCLADWRPHLGAIAVQFLDGRSKWRGLQSSTTLDLSTLPRFVSASRGRVPGQPRRYPLQPVHRATGRGAPPHGARVEAGGGHALERARRR